MNCIVSEYYLLNNYLLTIQLTIGQESEFFIR